MGYGKNLLHEHFESLFSDFIGSKFSIVFSSGGVAMQSALRALDLPFKGSVIHQVDTCSATPQAILNSGYIPKFCDISPIDFKLDQNQLSNSLDLNTKVLLVTHMWGSVEKLEESIKFSQKNKLHLIEDCCLSLGSYFKQEHVGNFGICGIFSMGSTKPIQAGEAGIVTTNDESLFKTLIEIRNWGCKTDSNDFQDFDKLSYNGRISEFVIPVAISQLKNYKKRLSIIKNNLHYLKEYLGKFEDLISIPDFNNFDANSFTQLNLIVSHGVKIDKLKLNLNDQGIFTNSYNFKPLNNSSFFLKGEYGNYINPEYKKLLKRYTQGLFPNANNLYLYKGLGIPRINFEGNQIKSLAKKIENALLNLSK